MAKFMLDLLRIRNYKKSFKIKCKPPFFTFYWIYQIIWYFSIVSVYEQLYIAPIEKQNLAEGSWSACKLMWCKLVLLL